MDRTSQTPQTADLIGCAEAGTLAGLFRERVRRSPFRVAYREFVPGAGWTDRTWQEMDALVGRVRTALARISLRAGDRVAIALPNGPDWSGIDIAALSLGLVVVPLFLHDSAENTAFIVGHSGARLVVLDTWERWEALSARTSASTELEHVWIRDSASDPGTVARGPHPRRLADMLPAQAEPAAEPALSPTGLATIIYTSGTTGQPKGVMLSHRALLWNAEAVGRVIPPKPDDVFLSCLPLAHALERTVGYYLPMMAGSMVAYARSVGTLGEDFAAIRPTAFLGVPRLYERAYAAIRARTAHRPVTRWVVDLAMSVGWRRFEAAQGRADPPPLLARIVWPTLDRRVARRVRAAFGGHIRAAVSGGAALPTEVARFFLGMGLPIVEGYGLTEAAPVVTANGLGDNLPGSVGRPLRGVDVGLAAKGELIVRTPGAMLGYWRDPTLTAEVLDKQGWLHTGDIAEIADGRVFVHGRLKDVLVLATGEKVAPSQIEAAILRDPLFKQVLIVGEGKPFLGAIAVLDGDEWLVYARTQGLDPKDPNATECHGALQQRISATLRDRPHHAQIRALHSTFELWTTDAGLLTPTLKPKRERLERKYAAQIALLYAGHPTFG